MGILWGICLENIWKCEINDMKVKCSKSCCWSDFCVLSWVKLLSKKGDFV